MAEPVKLKKILVVEDDQALRDLYILILKDAGFEVDSAEDGQLGLDAILRGGYDLVLLDIVLPKIDGIHILETLKTTVPAIPNGNIVVLSNLGHDDIVGRAIELGASGYLIKSDHTPDQIVSAVKDFLS